MKKFALAIIAATALVPVAAAAATGPAGGPPKAGVTWRNGGGNHMMMQRKGRQGGAQNFIIHRRGGGQVMGGSQMMGGHQMKGSHRMRGGHQMWGGHQMKGGHGMKGGGHHGINRHHRYKRIDRGFFVPNFWWGPQFQIQNWGMYGFSQPVEDRRWVRYFDDALLIDRSGRVLDGRYGMNWDGYADQWAYDDEGIPYYEGDDYAEDEGYGYEDRVYVDRRGPPPPPPMPCPQACGYQGYGYGYGWMPGGMVTITETTVHAAAPQKVTETVYIERKVKAKPRRSYKRAKPRPQPGERG